MRADISGTASRRTLRRITGLLVTALLTLGATEGMSPQPTVAAEATSPESTPAAMAVGHHHHHWNMQRRFAREVTKYGNTDTDAYHIQHVYELQYRLTWAKVYAGPVTGHFGPLTRGAVKRFQKKVHLRVTGVANHQTWRELIKRTVRARGLIPHICETRGWHACYDRKRHQLTLWHKGRIRNSWLGRSGDRGVETRLGNFTVYYRDKDHVSSLYDLPMPYSQFFSGGQALHGSVLMVDPWVDHSHGCINLYIKDARQLWSLTSQVKLYVTVYGAWD
jgi:peptidoglycan hydrolase-like protein with peptidoglycan-binding domain